MDLEIARLTSAISFTLTVAVTLTTLQMPQADLHTAGATSTTFSLAEQNSDIIAVMPGYMDTGDSLQSQPGAYVLRCHTAAHVDGGMQALYTINASEAATAAALTGTDSSAVSSVISALAFLSQVCSRVTGWVRHYS